MNYENEENFFSGLFLGLLTLVGGIIILIIFFVMKETPEYRAQMHWIYAGQFSAFFTFKKYTLSSLHGLAA
jgi:hypothetical protein